MSAHQKKVETAKITRDMTQGNPYGHMVAFAMPVLLSQIFQQLYNTADTLSSASSSARTRLPPSARREH